MPLEQQINAFNKQLATQIPTEIIEAFNNSITNLKKLNIEQKCIQTSDLLPDFYLPNSKGEFIQSASILQQGKLIITFFRGAWCPYCNLELQALQKNLSAIQNKGATLVAISPQRLEKNYSLINEHTLQFDLLTDLILINTQ